MTNPPSILLSDSTEITGSVNVVPAVNLPVYMTQYVGGHQIYWSLACTGRRSFFFPFFFVQAKIWCSSRVSCLGFLLYWGTFKNTAPLFPKKMRIPNRTGSGLLVVRKVLNRSHTHTHTHTHAKFTPAYFYCFKGLVHEWRALRVWIHRVGQSREVGGRTDESRDLGGKPGKVAPSPAPLVTARHSSSLLFPHTTHSLDDEVHLLSVIFGNGDIVKPNNNIATSSLLAQTHCTVCIVFWQLTYFLESFLSFALSADCVYS